MDHINLLYQELLANPNDMFVRQVLTDACAEAGVYCPDLLGQTFPIVPGNWSWYHGGSSCVSKSGTRSVSTPYSMIRGSTCDSRRIPQTPISWTESLKYR